MVQYMVWAQLVLLAIVAAFVCLTGEDVMWRWDLPFLVSVCRTSARTACLANKPGNRKAYGAQMVAQD